MSSLFSYVGLIKLFKKRVSIRSACFVFLSLGILFPPGRVVQRFFLPAFSPHCSVSALWFFPSQCRFYLTFFSFYFCGGSFFLFFSFLVVFFFVFLVCPVFVEPHTKVIKGDKDSCYCSG